MKNLNQWHELLFVAVTLLATFAAFTFIAAAITALLQ
mgnify:CR=1 FL=1